MSYKGGISQHWGTVGSVSRGQTGLLPCTTHESYTPPWGLATALDPPSLGQIPASRLPWQKATATLVSREN